jgi:hypothetical protein
LFGTEAQIGRAVWLAAKKAVGSNSITPFFIFLFSNITIKQNNAILLEDKTITDRNKLNSLLID